MCGIFFSVSNNTESINNNADVLTNRGPDQSREYTQYINPYTLTYKFYRLAIRGLDESGMQPFLKNHSVAICNGEVYNFEELIKKYNLDISTSDSDCSVILPILEKRPFDYLLHELDAEFALVVYDSHTNCIYAARDRFGVRPLYYAIEDNSIFFASELKALYKYSKYVQQVKPSYLYTIDLSKPRLELHTSMYFDIDRYNFTSTSIKYNLHSKIHDTLIKSVNKRLASDQPIGFLLSGGLDSSLVVAIASRLLGPDKITCFSIGMDGSPDVEAAKQVVEYLGIKNHHIIPFNVDLGMKELPNVIRTIESFDTTTIRASTPQYIMAKYIRDNTNIKVLLSGEGADEICGSYRYFRDAPNVIDFTTETVRLLSELCYFDNLRTDRTMAGCGLEVRVPYLDFEYVDLIKSIPQHFLMNSKSVMEKKIIRDSFKGYLPDPVLYRSKEAFSDAVSSKEVNWYKSVQKYAEEIISDVEFNNRHLRWTVNIPHTKEAYYYRTLFENEYGNTFDSIIPHYWLPRFQKEVVVDPSATVLSSY
jgi:asparagine synthase (glutamine-hydrolysing)